MRALCSIRAIITESWKPIDQRGKRRCAVAPVGGLGTVAALAVDSLG